MLYKCYKDTFPPTQWCIFSQNMVERSQSDYLSKTNCVLKSHCRLTVDEKSITHSNCTNEHSVTEIVMTYIFMRTLQMQEVCKSETLTH